MATEQVGLLVIRARVKEGAPKPLRANVRFTSDITRGFTHELSVAEVDGVVDVVRRWLEGLPGQGAADALE